MCNPSLHLISRSGNVPAMDTTNHVLPAQARVMVEAKARRKKALAMYRAGKTYKEIGEAMGGITHQRAQQIVAKAIRDEGDS